MTASRALYSFYSSFGIPVYDENSVPTGKNAPNFPYLTYSFSYGGFSDPVSLNMSIWYRGESWIPADDMMMQICARLESGGVQIPFDDGSLWMTKGSPFAQRMGDPDDDMIKRYVFNVTANFLRKD